MSSIRNISNPFHINGSRRLNAGRHPINSLRLPCLLTAKNIKSIIRSYPNGFNALFVFHKVLNELAAGPLSLSAHHIKIARKFIHSPDIEVKNHPNMIGGSLSMSFSENKQRILFRAISCSLFYGMKKDMTGMIEYLRKMLEESGIEILESKKFLRLGFEVHDIVIQNPQVKKSFSF